MRRFISVIALLGAAAATFALGAGEKIKFSSKDLGGSKVTNAVFAKNRVTMVNVWATYCGPCISEMPDLGKLGAAYKGKRFAIVGIPMDITDNDGNVAEDKKSKCQSIVKQTGANYTHVIPTGKMLGGFLAGVSAVPTTIFVGSDGRQIGEAYVGSRSREDWQKIIDGILADAQRQDILDAK